MQSAWRGRSFESSVLNTELKNGGILQIYTENLLINNIFRGARGGRFLNQILGTKEDFRTPHTLGVLRNYRIVFFEIHPILFNVKRHSLLVQLQKE